MILNHAIFFLTECMNWCKFFFSNSHDGKFISDIFFIIIVTQKYYLVQISNKKQSKHNPKLISNTAHHLGNIHLLMILNHAIFFHVRVYDKCKFLFSSHDGKLIFLSEVFFIIIVKSTT